MQIQGCKDSGRNRCGVKGEVGTLTWLTASLSDRIQVPPINAILGQVNAHNFA